MSSVTLKVYDALVLRQRGMGRLRGLVIGSVAFKLLDRVDFTPLVAFLHHCHHLPILEEVAVVLQSLPSSIVVRTIHNLQVSYAATVLGYADDTFLQRILPQLEPQLLTSILMHLSQESRKRFRKFISGKIEEQVRDLLEYPDGSVGRIMTSDFLSFRKDVTAREAISKICVMIVGAPLF